MDNENDKKDSIRFAAITTVLFAFLVALTVSAFLGNSPSSFGTFTPNDTKYMPPTFPTYTYATFPTFTIPTLYPFEQESFPDPDKELHEIELIRSPGYVRRNEMATITIKGEPFTKYRITVIYPSGESTAKGLNDQWSDRNEYVTWQWKIGGQTSFGLHRAIITDEKNTITVYFRVTG